MIDADMSVINDNGQELVTDFCSEIDSLKAVYSRSDNVILTVKPMDCAESESIDQADLEVYNKYCVDFTKTEPEKPRVLVNSAFVNFNITNEATFEDINFEGNDNIAFYQEGGNKGKPVVEFPVQVCN